MGYSGWHAICDEKHMLLSVSYEPVEGSLFCRMWSGDTWRFCAVPENKYLILLRSKFAGSYFRKFIMRSYRCEDMNGIPMAFKASKPPEKKLQKVDYPNPERGLFGPMPVIPGACRPKRKKGSTHS